jgi:antitoxin HicB
MIRPASMKKKRSPSKHFAPVRQDVLAQSGASAVKHKLARELKKTMRRGEISKATMAKKLETSRPAIDRLLDPANMSITLNTMGKVAHLLGKRIDFALK